MKSLKRHGLKVLNALMNLDLNLEEMKFYKSIYLQKLESFIQEIYIFYKKKFIYL